MSLYERGADDDTPHYRFVHAFHDNNIIRLMMTMIDLFVPPADYSYNSCHLLVNSSSSSA
jgi:hypothetical protein